MLAEEMRQAKAITTSPLTSGRWQIPLLSAHYIDDNAHLQTTLIGLRRVIGSHAGEIIAEQQVQVIQEYGIEKKLGYFVLDNATSNDTCVKAILNEIRPDLIKKEQKL